MEIQKNNVVNAFCLFPVAQQVIGTANIFYGLFRGIGELFSQIGQKLFKGKAVDLTNFKKHMATLGIGCVRLIPLIATIVSAILLAKNYKAKKTNQTTLPITEKKSNLIHTYGALLSIPTGFIKTKEKFDCDKDWLKTKNLDENKEYQWIEYKKEDKSCFVLFEGDVIVNKNDPIVLFKPDLIQMNKALDMVFDAGMQNLQFTEGVAKLAPKRLFDDFVKSWRLV